MGMIRGARSVKVPPFFSYLLLPRVWQKEDLRSLCSLQLPHPPVSVFTNANLTTKYCATRIWGVCVKEVRGQQRMRSNYFNWKLPPLRPPAHIQHTLAASAPTGSAIYKKVKMLNSLLFLFCLLQQSCYMGLRTRASLCFLTS